MINFEELIFLFSCGHATRGIIRMDLDEAALLYKYVKRITGDVVEIGTKYGGSAILIAAAMQRGQIVHSIDLVTHPRCTYVLVNLPKDITDKIDFIIGKSTVIAASWEKPSFMRKELSLVVIDGDHAVSAVHQDVSDWGKFVHSGGYMILHDVRDAGLGLEIIVDEMKENGWQEVDCAGSLVVLQK